MAVLSVSSLTNCFYIPDFIGSGSKMIFESTSAPTSWVKDTTHNNKSLRIINGTISNGGSQNFSSVFASRSFSGSTSSNPGGGSLQLSNPGITLSAAPFGFGTVGSVVATNPPHTHSYSQNNTVDRRTEGSLASFFADVSENTGGAGGNGQHNHNIGPAVLDATHQHESGGVHTHSTTENPHSHSVSFSQSYNVYYRDVIIATKD
jgi:hypothetical protein